MLQKVLSTETIVASQNLLKTQAHRLADKHRVRKDHIRKRSLCSMPGRKVLGFLVCATPWKARRCIYDSLHQSELDLFAAKSCSKQVLTIVHQQVCPHVGTRR